MKGISWVLYCDAQWDPGDVLGPPGLVPPMVRWILHGGPGAYTGVLDPGDWREWQGVEAVDPHWAQTVWHPFSMNGLLLLSELLFGLAGDGPVRVWIIYSGPWFNMYERQYRIAPLVECADDADGCILVPLSQYRELLRNTEPAGAAPLPPMVCAYRADQPSRIAGLGWPWSFGPLDPLLVAYGGDSPASELALQRALDESDHTVFAALWEWAMQGSSSCSSPDVFRDARFVATGYGADSADLGVYWNQGAADAGLERLIAFCADHDIALYTDHGAAHYRSPDANHQREVPFPPVSAARLI